MNITLSIQDDIPLALKESAEKFTQDLRFLTAVMWYRRSKLSLGKAAALAGYSKLDFIERMQRGKIPAVKPLLDAMIAKGRWYSTAVYQMFLRQAGEL